MMKTLYTIGYSGFQLEDFIRTLEQRHVSAVVDVRSSPVASAYFSDYNGELLGRSLMRRNIHYRCFGEEFGGRPMNRELYGEGGCLDYERVASSEPFLKGIERLQKGMSRGYTFALLCAEKQPINCHRAILVARAFFERGHEVVHLLPENQSITQEDLNAQLIELYYPNRAQLDLFETPPADETLLLAEAYRRRNAEIGYRLHQSEKGCEP
ncbi:MAG: DUF488 domain-containing protein [Synergistaceae bacterium]|nr:DUF488 domain-containing protein [Synergistaceae bacterium]